MTARFEALAAAPLRRLRAYDPGHDIEALRRRFDALVELGANENPYGPSPRALDAARAALAGSHRYPDPGATALKAALADRLGVDPARLVLGNGSHELLMLLAQAFAGPGRGVAMSRFGFAVYAIAAAATGAPLAIAAALPADAPMPHGHDLDALAAATDRGVRIVYLANPNNPTGTWFSADAFAAFVTRVPDDVIVVVDEAYREYVDPSEAWSALGAQARHRNVVVTGTFSKAYGLAGLRVGYAVADPGIATLLERLRESFNVNLPAQVAATAALSDEAHLQRVVCANREQRQRLGEALRARGLSVHPSQTNFLLVGFDEAPRVEAEVLARGVVLRPMAGYGLPGWLRVTVGSADENTRLLAALDEVLQ